MGYALSFAVVKAISNTPMFLTFFQRDNDPVDNVSMQFGMFFTPTMFLIAFVCCAVLNLMEDAEELISKGADKKAWVMAGVANLADEIDYDIDEAQLSELIDQLCEMSKKINVLGDDAE